MTDSGEELERQRRTMRIVTAYPLVLLLIGFLANGYLLGVNPLAVALPSSDGVVALIIAAALLVINHTWLMTTTELTRVRFRLHSTPEEWAASGTRKEDAPEDGLRELERRHNAHRNTTENTIYFIFLALVFVSVSPPAAAQNVWLLSFPIARLGYTYSYLAGRDGMRGAFMSISLLAIYGMVSYLAMSLFVTA